MGYFLQLFKNLRFKHKLFLSYSVVVIIPVLALGMFYFERSKSSLEDQARLRLNVSLEQMANNLNYKVSRCKNAIDFLAFNLRLQQLFSKDHDDYMNVINELTDYLLPLFSNVIHLNNDIEKLILYNENNVPEYDRFVRSYNRVRDAFWYKNATERNIWYYSDGEFFCVRRLIDFYSNKRLGVIYIKLNYNRFFESIVGSKAEEYGIFVTDENQKVLFSKETFKIERFKVPEAVIRTHEEGVAHINGIDYLILKKNVSEASWIIFYYTPLNLITIDAHEIVNATLLIVSMCIIILIFIIWLFSNTFVKRIHSLNQQMKKVQDGDLQIQVSSSSLDEIGELTNNFGMMLKRINSLIEEVYQSKIIQKEAEFRALQAQINPHFLYNILSLINWKAKLIYAKDISHIANTVSKFYRTTLNNGENIISVQDEVLNTKSYLEIQLIMHDYSFDVDYTFDQAIFEYSMIKLVLQPIVENAIVHGIDKKRDGRGRLEVKGSIRQEQLEFLISDNGPGISAEQIEQILTKQSKGYGLSNVQERIKLFFGNEYGIEITSVIGEGTLVRVTLPCYHTGTTRCTKPGIHLPV